MSDQDRAPGSPEEEASRPPEYFALETPIPPHLRARLQAVAAVTGRSVADVLEIWLEREMDRLDEARREVVDRIASSSLNASLRSQD